MKLYKLTDMNFETYNHTKWGEGVTHEAHGSTDDWANVGLCSSSWIHAYEDPRTGVLMNTHHGDFTSPVLWEAEGEVGRRDGPLKCGCRKLTTLRRILLPEMTQLQRVRMAIASANMVLYTTLAGCYNSSVATWHQWVHAWLAHISCSSGLPKALAGPQPPDGLYMRGAQWAAYYAAMAYTRYETVDYNVARTVALAFNQDIPRERYYACLEWSMGNDPLDVLYPTTSLT